MFNKGKINPDVCILALGLNDVEKSYLIDLYSNSTHKIIFSDTDMDMWDQADHKKYDLCIIGQNKENQDLDYITWLLKEILKPSQIVVITSNYSREVLKHLRKHRIRFILNRPLDPALLSDTIEKALTYNKSWYIRVISLLK